MSFLIIEKPTSILMLIPILMSIHLTSILYVRMISIFAIFLFTFGNLILFDEEYYELWGICIYLIFYFVFLARNKFGLRNETDITKDRQVNDESYIYNREFKKDFTFEEFSTTLLKNCDIRRHKGKKKLFISEGAHFNTIYYFVIIPKNALVTLRHQNIIISYLQDSSWIGVVEFISQIFDDSKRSWNVGLEVDNNSDEEIVWLEWNKDFFHKLFKNHKNTSFLKKLLTNWIKYLSLSTYKMDDHVVTALGVVADRKFGDYPQALPLVRYMSGLNSTLDYINEGYEDLLPERKPLLDNTINPELPI